MTIRSMTGYGSGSVDTEGLRITVELRTVNNRFADVRFRLPQDLACAEQGIRKRVLAGVRRGRVELNLRIERIDGRSGQQLNRELLEEYLSAAETMRTSYGLSGELQPTQMLGLPGLFRSEGGDHEWTDERRAGLDAAVDAALVALNVDRDREGANLQRDLLERLDSMIAITAQIRSRAAQLPSRLKQRLLDRLAALSGEAGLDPGRLEQEAVLLAERCDVTEEIVRLEGHLDQTRAIVNDPKGTPLGKRVEFLLQEIHRETNTINSKSADLELSRAALELKSESEKVREQIQNVE